MKQQPYRGSISKPQPITSLQMAMISQLVRRELGFKPSEFPATYQAAERLIWALTPSVDESNTAIAEGRINA